MDAMTRKTFGEWMDIYVAEQRAAYEKHPDLQHIEKGAAMHLTGIYTNPTGPQLRRDAYTPLGQRYYDAYEKFISSPRGKAMLAKWKADGELDPQDQAYRWVIQATLVKPHHLDRSKPEGRGIMKLVKRVYFRDTLSRAEVDSMRTYFAGMAKSLGYTCGSYAYAGGRQWMDWGAMDWSQHLEYPNGLPVGELIPDIRFLSYDALVANEPMDPSVGRRYNLHAFLTPEAMQSFNSCVNALEMKKVGDRTLFVPNYAEWEGRDCVIKLRDEVKKGKPIYLFAHSTSDTFDYIYDVSAQECLRMLFKDKVEFFHADVRRQAADYCGGKRYYLQRLWKVAVFKDAHYTSVHDNDEGFESWVYQIRDSGYMRYPLKSAPVLLDTRRAANFIAYEKTIGFVDRHGTKCPNVPNPKLAFYDAHLPKHRKQIPNISYVPTTYPMRIRWGIPLFKTMEAMDWEYKADSPHLKGYADLCKNRPWQEFAFFVINKGVVQKVDLAKRELVLRGTVSKLKGAAEEDHVIHFSDRPRILSRTGDVGAVTTDIADVSAGDTVSVFFQIKPGTEDHKFLRAVSRTAGLSPLHSMNDLFWVVGEITAVDSGKGVCTVQMPKPDVAKGEWLGFQYWKEAEQKYGISPADLPERGRTRKLYMTGKAMLFGDDRARVFNLLIDDGVEISVNGSLEYDLSGVKVGDRAVFSFNMADIKNAHPSYRPWHLMVVTKDRIKLPEVTQ